MSPATRVRRAWAALGRDAETRRLVQLAAACGAAVFAASGGPGCPGEMEMKGLLMRCLEVESGCGLKRNGCA